jgi:predicted small secreted protein
MKPMALLALAFVILWAALLTGCASMGGIGISLETDFGRFTYQVPEIPALKDK